VLSGPQEAAPARWAPEKRPVVEAGAARRETLGALLLGVLGGVLGLLFAQRLARSSRAAAEARVAQGVDPHPSVVLGSAVPTGGGFAKRAVVDLVELNAGGVDSATGAVRGRARATSRGGGSMQL